MLQLGLKCIHYMMYTMFQLQLQLVVQHRWILNKPWSTTRGSVFTKCPLFNRWEKNHQRSKPLKKLQILKNNSTAQLCHFSKTSFYKVNHLSVWKLCFFVALFVLEKISFVVKIIFVWSCFEFWYLKKKSLESTKRCILK